MRFILTIGLDCPDGSRLTRKLMDEDTSLSDIDSGTIRNGITGSIELSVISCEVVDTKD